MRIYRDMDLVEQLGFGAPRILQTYGKECFYFFRKFYSNELSSRKGDEKIEFKRNII